MGDLHVDVLGRGDRVVLVHGSGPRDATWRDQLPLADRYQLVLPHRRGYGSSPHADSNFETDAADIAELLGGAHLVGFSYGGVSSLLAAARRPEAVRTLAVIEPPAFGVAPEHPAVTPMLERFVSLYEDAPQLTVDEFGVRFGEAIGFPPSDTPMSEEDRETMDALRRERPPFEARIPFAELRATAFPKLVVSGNWSAAFDAVADAIAGEIGAHRYEFSECGGHGPQHDPRFNDVIERFWETGRP